MVYVLMSAYHWAMDGKRCGILPLKRKRGSTCKAMLAASMVDSASLIMRRTYRTRGNAMLRRTMATKRQLRERWKEEPGATIWQKMIDYIRSTSKWRPDATPEENDRNQTLDSSIIFELLDGLPFRDEVPSSRDLRASDLGGGWRSDFSDTDFSYSKSLGGFFHCNLTGAKFDECVTERTSFRDVLNGASFRNARLRSCYMIDGQARHCCFDNANIYSMNFEGTDLSGS